MKYDALVIGAGISGLTCASLLAKRGLKVCVVEGQFKPGGSSGIFKRNGVVFDQGSAMIYGFGEQGFNPHRFVFNCLEMPIDVLKHEVLYCVYFKGKKITFYQDLDRFIKELSEVFPSQSANIKKFYYDMADLYKKIIAEKPVFSSPDMVKKEQGLKQLLSHPLYYFKFLSYLNKNTYDLLHGYFDDPEIFKFFDKLTSTYCYTTVKETPAVLSAIMFTDNHFGGSYYPAGSTLFLVGLLERAIEENGGDMLYESEAQKIIVENNKAKGVILKNGERILADSVIYSGTVWNLYGKMLKGDCSPKRQEFANKIIPTYPSLVLYSIVEKEVIPDGTNPIEMIAINPDMIDEGEITVYIMSIDDKTLCPCNMQTVIAIGPSFSKWPSGQSENYHTDSYTECKKVEKERMLKALENRFPGFKAALLYSEIATPSTIERYTFKNGGAVAGPKQCLGQHMLKRLHTTTEIKSLFCCGESTVMGTGTPAVTVSGVSAANGVLRELNLLEFEYNPDAKNYVRNVDRPFKKESLGTYLSDDKKELMGSSLECEFCEKPACIQKCPLHIDIRGILRRCAVGNFVGAKKAGGSFMEDVPCLTCVLKLCEINCKKLSFSDNPVKISSIITKVSKL